MQQQRLQLYAVDELVAAVVAKRVVGQEIINFRIRVDVTKDVVDVESIQRVPTNAAGERCVLVEIGFKTAEPSGNGGNAIRVEV